MRYTVLVELPEDTIREKVEAPGPLQAANRLQRERALPAGTIIHVQDRTGRPRRYHVRRGGITVPGGVTE